MRTRTRQSRARHGGRHRARADGADGANARVAARGRVDGRVSRARGRDEDDETRRARGRGDADSSTVSRARQGNVARAGESDDTIAYEDLVVGSGVEPLVGVDVVKVDAPGRRSRAVGRRVDEAKFFVFGVGAGEVVPGFDRVVGGDGASVPAMRVGGRRRAVVPAALAYGDRGAGCRAGECEIPPGSTLVFEVELVSVR